MNRRNFLQSTMATAALLAVEPLTSVANASKKDLTETRINKKNISCFRGVQIGTITYSYREQSNRAGDMLLYALSGGVGSVELMSDAAETFTGVPVTYHLEGDEAKACLERFKQLGMLYRQLGVDVHIVKYNPHTGMSREQLEYVFKACQAIGAAGLSTELSHSAAKEIAPIAEKYGKYLIFHNHGQPSEKDWPGFDSFLSPSKAIMLNFDAGHYYGYTGKNPCDVIREYHDRIYSIHMKDKTGPNHSSPNQNMPWGQGETPIAEVLELLAKNAGKKDWPKHVDIELEYNVPQGSTPREEVGKCLEFCRNVLK